MASFARQPPDRSSERRRGKPTDRRHALKLGLLRVLIAANLLLGIHYLSWRWLDTLNWSAWWYALPLVLAETYAYIDAWFFGLTIWRQRQRGAPPPPPTDAAVDVFITRYDEPVELVRRTVRAARSIAYPHRTYLLDDGDSPEVRRMRRQEASGRFPPWRRRSF